MRYALLFFPLLLVSTVLGDGLRTFTNKEGQTIRARMIRLDGDVAVIEREDRQMFRLPLDVLSAEDQVYARRWPAMNALRNESQVEIRTRRSRIGRSVDYQPPNLPGITSYRATRQDLVYQIVFNNRSTYDIEGLTVEYRIFKDLAQHDAPRSNRPVPIADRVVKEGILKLERAGARVETILETEPFSLVETVREEWGLYDPQLDRYRTVEVRREDSLHGIWIRVMNGEEIVREDISPPTLTRRFSWD